MCQECRLGIDRRYAREHSTRTQGFCDGNAESIVTEVYRHDVVKCKDLNLSGPLDGFHTVTVLKCADCEHMVETKSGHAKHARKSDHDRKPRKVLAQRIFPTYYLEIEQDNEVVTSERLERFEQLYPEEPMDGIVQPMGVGMDDELLRRAGWSTLLQGMAAKDVLKLLEKPEQAGDGLDAWIAAGWRVLSRVEPSLLAYLENCEKPTASSRRLIPRVAADNTSTI